MSLPTFKQFLTEGVLTKDVENLYQRLRAMHIEPADINTSSLKFELNQAKRFGDPSVLLTIRGTRLALDIADAELLLKARAAAVSTLTRMARRY